MPEISGIYDSAPIQPVAKIKEKLAIYSRNIWEYWLIDYIEGIPRSSQSVVETITAAGIGTSIAANGMIPRFQIAPLLLNLGDLLHLRWEPLDDVEGVLWEQPSEARFATRAIQARVNLYTNLMDPYLATTTFFLLGRDRLMNLQVMNPNPVIIFVARFVFFGFRYVLTQIKTEKFPEQDQKNLKMGDVDAVRKCIGPAVTWLPAEGMA